MNLPQVSFPNMYIGLASNHSLGCAFHLNWVCIFMFLSPDAPKARGGRY